MNKPIRTVAVFCMLLFLALMVNATYLQFVKASSLNDNGLNHRPAEAAYSSQRGSILVDRQPIVESMPVDDQYDFQRVYDNPFVYAPVTGYFTIGSQTGIESSQNTTLTGDDPRLFVPNLVNLFSNGSSEGGSVELTLNPKAQQAAYDGLHALGADIRGAVVAIEPNTGRILAMVSLPTFNPNNLATHDFGAAQATYNRLDGDKVGQPLLNRAIQTRLFPGSTFKLVTAAAALESGKYSGANAMVPGGDSYRLPDSTRSVTNEVPGECGSGSITLTQAMDFSCNTTFAPLAVEVGAEGMLKQAEAFGFNDDSYLDDIGGLAASNYPTDANKPNTALSGFGQFEVQATPLQMAMVAAGIANNGVVMKPYLVDEVESADFDAQKNSPKEYSQAVSKGTADTLRQLMVSVVDEGTGTAAQIDGVAVAGKTGTAQSGVPGKNPYAWFTSFAPAGPDDVPQVAVAVMIENIAVSSNDVAGGKYGGPIAKAVMQAVLNK